MNQQPPLPRPQPPYFPLAIAFFDGQNLFYSAKRAFGYTYLNYDPKKLAQRICNNQGWQLAKVQFYTGTPEASDHRSHFWRAKFNQMKRRRRYSLFKGTAISRRRGHAFKWSDSTCASR